MKRLHLIVPGLLGPMRLQSQDRHPIYLESVLARANIQTDPSSDAVTLLFDLFGLDAEDQTDIPHAAVSLLGEGLDPGDACWIRVDPVHLAPDRDRLVLLDARHLDIQADEAATLVNEINNHLDALSLKLVAPAPDRWYMQCADVPSFNTSNLHEVAGRHVEQFMPNGLDSAEWRRIMTELQMLLFQSGINQQRMSQGKLPINGVWFSGVGSRPAESACRIGQVFANDPFYAGLALLNRVPFKHLPVDLGNLSGKHTEEVVVLDNSLLGPVWDGDETAWLDGLARFENGLKSLIANLQDAELMLYPLAGSSYRLNKKYMRRFWRRRTSLSKLMDNPD